MFPLGNIHVLQRRIKRNTTAVLLFCLFLGYIGGLYSDFIGTALKDPFASKDPHPEVPFTTLKKILKLERQNRLLRLVLKQHNIEETEYSDSTLPVIYVITPTYARPHQKAELTRLKNVFLHVPSLHWIVVEDAEEESQLVSRFLKLSGLTYTHLNKPTPEDWKLQKYDPNWRKPRGVLQRNAGIKWLRRKSSHEKLQKGVVYFADDDNTYSIELFNEMRDTKIVSVWPVGIVGGVMVERPQVSLAHDRSQHQVTGWLTGWKPDRPFATDMAGFAINLDVLLKNKRAEFSYSSQRGFLESDFLQKLTTKDQLEPKADLCTKVYVWHTQTIKPDMKDEERLRRSGKSTDEGIEV